jgi:PiT family inorganic phosphate transporter
MELQLVIIGVVFALLFDFVNGINDAANSIATIVATRVLKPLQAVAWAAFWNFAAVAIGQLKVASMIGKGVVHSESVTTEVILAALVGAIIWSFSCSQLGLPISVSHALVGGLLGAALLYAGPGSVIWLGLIKIGAFIVLAPTIGSILAYIFMIFVTWAFRNADRRKVNRLFRHVQLFSAALFSLGHGTGDAQKTMGVIGILLLTAGMGSRANGIWLNQASFDKTGFVPNWVVFAAFTAIALGTLVGGWKNIRTLGVRLTHLRSMEASCAETAAAVSILGTAYFGIPVSTTHTISGAITGVGAIRRLTAVRWGVMRTIVWAWILTIPCSAIVAALTYKLLVLLLHNR